MAKLNSINLDDTELRTVTVDGNSDGIVCRLTRRIDSKSVLSITDENKTRSLILVGREIRTSGPIGSSIHIVNVRETFGKLAIEYPIMVVGYVPSRNFGSNVSSQSDAGKPAKPVAIIDKKANICFTDIKQVSPDGWNSFKFLTGSDKNLNANKKISLLTAEGDDTGWTATLDNAQGASNQGKTTGDDSGVYPDQIIGWYAYNGDSVGNSNGGGNIPVSNVTISGLDPDKIYNIRVFASRSLSPRATIYTIGNETIVLDTSNNTSRTADFKELTPNDDGIITIKWERQAGQSYGHLSAISIVEV